MSWPGTSSLLQRLDTDSKVFTKISTLQTYLQDKSQFGLVTKHSCGKNKHNRFEQTIIQDSNGCLFIPIWNLMSQPHPITVLPQSVITQTASFANCTHTHIHTHTHTHTHTQQFSHSYKKCRRYLKTLQAHYMGMGTLGHLSQESKSKAVIKEKSDLLEDIIPLEARTDGICCDRTACSMGWM